MAFTQLKRLGPRLSSLDKIEFSEEDERSLISSIGDKTIGGIAAVGNVLDLPGSMVRDMLGGENPLDQLLSPLSHKNRLTGRDLFRKHGLIGRRDTWGNFAGGLAAEIATDPLSYMTFGASALSKGGQIVKNAGLMKDAAKIASKQTAKIGGKEVFGLGKRLGRMKTTVGDVMGEASEEGLEALTKAAKGLGVDNLDELRQQKLGGLVGLGLPFKDPSKVFGKNLLAQRAAHWHDLAGQTVRESAPVRTLAGIYDHRLKDMYTKTAQAMGLKSFDVQEEAISRFRKEVAPLVRQIDNVGMFDVEKYGAEDVLKNSLELTEWFEDVGVPRQQDMPGVWRPTSGELPLPKKFEDMGIGDTLRKIKTMNRDTYIREHQAGAYSPDLDDAFIAHFPRLAHFFGVSRGTGGGKSAQMFDLKNPHHIARTFRDIQGGTATLQRMSLDKEISGVASGLGRKLDADNIAQIQKVIEQRYPEVLTRRVREAGQAYNEHAPQKSTRDLAVWVAHLDPQHAQKGIPVFEINPLKALMNRSEHGERTISAVNGILDVFAEDAMDEAGSMIHAAERMSKPKINSLYDAMYGDRTGQGPGGAGLGPMATTQVIKRLENSKPELLKHAEQQARFIDHANVRKVWEEHRDSRLLNPDDQTRWKARPIVRIKDSVHPSTGRSGPTGIYPERPAITALNRGGGDVYEVVHIGDDGVVTLQGQGYAANPTATRAQASRTGQPRPGDPPRMNKVNVSNIESVDFDLGTEITKNLFVGSDITADTTRYLQHFTHPEAVGKMLQVVDKATNWFKSQVTAVFPAFHSRNWISGTIQNIIGRTGDPTRTGVMQYIGPMMDTWQMMQGKPIKGIGELFGTTDELGTEQLAELIFQHNLNSPRANVVGEVLGEEGLEAAAGLPGLKSNRTNRFGLHQRGYDLRKRAEMLFQPLSNTPQGTLPPRVSPGVAQALGPAQAPVESAWGKLQEIARRLEPVNPWYTAGAGAKSDVFIPSAIGRDIGNSVESVNRIAPFIGLLKQGVEPAEAARRVKMLQVDFQALSSTDRTVMRRIFPFYTFTKGVVPFFVKELMERPSGRLGRGIMTAGQQAGGDEMTPDYVRETASIPLGKLADGSNRYMTGFGVMSEDPLSFASGGTPTEMAQNFGMEVLSRMNPLIKGPMEAMVGQSFFQKSSGGVGGRPLTDLDPTVGRIIANVKQLATGGKREYQARPFMGSTMVEQTLANTPASRALTTARTLTDPRKLANPLALASNLLSGFRITDVSPASQDAILRENLTKMMEKMGARSFERTYWPKSELMKLPPGQRLEAMRAQAMMNLLARRSKERAAARD